MSGVTEEQIADNQPGSIKRPGKNVMLTIPTTGWSEPLSLQGYATGSFTVPAEWTGIFVQGGSSSAGPFGNVTRRSATESTDSDYGEIACVAGSRFYIPPECFADSHVRFRHTAGENTPVDVYLKA